MSQLLQFLGVASDKEWNLKQERLEASFRHSPSFESKAKHVATWIRLGEFQAYAGYTESLDSSLFKANLQRARSLTLSVSSATFQEVKTLCAQAGVSLVVAPCLPKVPISGAAYWIVRNRPVTQVSGRCKTKDHFSSALFHEAAHLLFDTNKEFHLDKDIASDTAVKVARAS